MAYTPIVIGSLNWGAPVNNAFTSQDARISALEAAGATASMLGLKAMPYDPALAAANTVLTSGTVFMIKVILPVAATISTVTFNLFSAGVLTAGQNFVGLYDSAGTRVAVSADQSVDWAGAPGNRDVALVAPFAAAAGNYWVAILSNGGTPIGVTRSVSNAIVAGTINHGLTIAAARWTTGPTAQTTLPASITMGTRTLSGTAFWTGVA